MVPAATSKRQPRLYIKQQAWLCSSKMSLRKTGIGLVWSAGCSLLTPGLDWTPCFTDEENRVRSSRPRHTLKSRAPKGKEKSSPLHSEQTCSLCVSPVEKDTLRKSDTEAIAVHLPYNPGLPEGGHSVGCLPSHLCSPLAASAGSCHRELLHEGQ